MRRWDDSAFFELILITTWFSQVSDLIHELLEILSHEFFKIDPVF